jgi:CheY-like chemotaxis protein
MAFIVAAIETQERRRRVQSVLAAAGHTVVMFGDGTRALAEVVDGRPDTVVIGDRLGDLTSAQFRAAVRAHPEVARIPVVVSSGGPREDDARWRDRDLREAVAAALGGA